MQRAALLDRVLRHLMGGGAVAAPARLSQPGSDAFATALASLVKSWRGDFAAAAAAAGQALADAADPDARALARAAAGFAIGGWPAAIDDPALRDPHTGGDPTRAALADRETASGAIQLPAYTLLAEAALANARVALASEFYARIGDPPPTLFGRAHPFLTFTRVLGARIAVFQGAVARARQLAAAAVDGARSPVESLFAQACSALVLGNADERRETRGLVERVWAEPPPVDAVTRGCFVLAGYGALALGQVARAARLILLGGGDPDLSHIRIIDRAFGLETLVRVAIDAGDADAAHSWYARLQMLATHPIAAPTAARVRSRLDLSAGDPESALAAAQLAAELATRDGRAVEAAEAEILIGRARLAQRQGRRAVQGLAGLVTAADARGHFSVGRSVAREMRPAGRRLPPEAASGWTGLSDREREVAVLLGRGRSNAAIAAELYLSEHTVRSHVTRVLHAFGTATRAGVAAQLADTGKLGRQPEQLPPLTARQTEIAERVAAGASNRQIAADLRVGVTTVDKHISTIKSRWNIRSRAEIAHLASRGAAGP